MSWAVQRLNEGLVVTTLKSADLSRLWSIHETEKEALKEAMNQAKSLREFYVAETVRANGNLEGLAKRYHEL